jgi:hypothetical protein
MTQATTMAAAKITSATTLNNAPYITTIDGMDHWIITVIEPLDGDDPRDPEVAQGVAATAKRRLAQHIAGSPSATMTWSGFRRTAWSIRDGVITATYVLPRQGLP